MPNESVKHGADTATAVVFGAILVAFVLLTATIIFAVVGGVNTNAGIAGSGTVAGEAVLPTTAGTAMSVNGHDGVACTVTAVLNGSKLAGTKLAATNYTVVAPCKLKNLTGEFLVSNWYVNYTYTYNANPQNLSGNMSAINDDLVGTVVNFFALMPTVGTILGVVVLIGVIVLLVVYVRRMSASGETASGSFVG